METRELFERLVQDEPALTISPAASSATAHHAAQRRGGLVSGVSVVVIVVAIIGAVQLAAPAQGDRGALGRTGGTHGTAGTTNASNVVTSLAFASAAQISASNAKVYDLLIKHAGGPSAVTHGSPTWDSNPVSDKTRFLGTQVQYAAPGGVASLTIVTGAPADSRFRYRDFGTGSPCAPSLGQDAGCSKTELPGGAFVWTYLEQSPPFGNGRSSSDKQVPVGRAALLWAPDGSTLAVSFGVVDAKSSPVALADPAVSPTLAQLRTLARDAALAWQREAASVGVTTVNNAGPASVAPWPVVVHLPSVAGPSIPSLPFGSTTQVAAGTDGLAAALVDLAGPAAVDRHPDRVTPADPTSYADESLDWTHAGVTYTARIDVRASGGPNVGLSAQAPPKGACTRPKTSDSEGALLECSRSRLPGGAVLGTWEIHTKLPGGGQAVAARQATVAAPDGSVLTLFVTTVTTHPRQPTDDLPGAAAFGSAQHGPGGSDSPRSRIGLAVRQLLITRVVVGVSTPSSAF